MLLNGNEHYYSESLLKENSSISDRVSRSHLVTALKQDKAKNCIYYKITSFIIIYISMIINKFLQFHNHHTIQLLGNLASFKTSPFVFICYQSIF